MPRTTWCLLAGWWLAACLYVHHRAAAHPHRVDSRATLRLGETSTLSTTPDAVCFASHEIGCFRQNAGGIGRAFFQQAAHLKRRGTPVVLVLLGVDPNDATTLNNTNLCPGNRDADLLRDDVIVPAFDATAARSYPFYHAPVQLVHWFREHGHTRCAVVHVADFLGQGAMLTAAKRAGMPWMQHAHVNVQVHGSDTMLHHQASLTVEQFRPYVDALERMQMAGADSAVFLSPQNADQYRTLWTLPRDVAIIPNIVSPSLRPGRTAGPVPPLPPSPWRVRPRHILYYGKMSEGKGLNLFMQAVALMPVSVLAGATIHIVGPRYTEEDHFAPLRGLAATANLTLTPHHNLDTAGAIALFRAHAADGIVVLPSYVEHQSFALFDVCESGAPFVASNIFGHRAQVPEPHWRDVLFDLVPGQLARVLTAKLEHGLEWTDAPASWIPVGVAERAWVAWYGERGFGSGKGSRGAADLPAHHHVPITVAITSCSRPAHLQRAIASVANQTHYPLAKLDVLVVASCPEADCAQAVTRGMDTLAATTDTPPALSCVSAGATTVSLGRARTLAVQRARSRAVVVMDETDVLARDAVAVLAQALEVNPGSGVVSGFAQGYDVGLGAGSLHGHKPTSRSFYIGPAPEVAFLADILGSSAMLVNRDSAFWTASGGFYDDISAGCDAWGLQAKAALVDALVLVPHTVVHQQALGDGDRTGWATASTDPKHIHNVRCRTKLLLDGVVFASGQRAAVDLRKMFPTLFYAVGLDYGGVGGPVGGVGG